MLFALVLLGSLCVRLRDIHASLPYCRHPDEVTWASIALRMVRTGSLDPGRYRKPSLPVYVMSTGFALGKSRTSLREPAGQVESYYRAPLAAEVPKALFALFSVFSLAALGLAAKRCLDDRRLLWLAPALAALSPSFYRHSWTYMNVDTIGTPFVLATLAFLLGFEARARAQGRAPGGAREAAIAGVLVGLSIGSKYNLFPIAVPVVLWFVLHEPRVWFRRAAVAGGVAVACLVVTTPYALVHSDVFIRDVLAEVRHYSTGRGLGHNARGSDAVPAGWPMLRTYLALFGASFGWPAFALAFAGVGLLARRSWRLALVVFAYPVCFILYMSMQQVFFERNALAVHLFVALAISVALVELPAFLARRAATPFPELGSRSRLTHGALGVAVCALVALGVPWTAVASAYSGEVDARHAVARWLKAHPDEGRTVVLDERIGLDPRTLPRGSRVIVLDPEARPLLDAEPATGEPHRLAVVPTESPSRWPKAMRGGRTVASFSTSVTRSPGRPAFHELAIIVPPPPERPPEQSGAPSPFPQ